MPNIERTILRYHSALSEDPYHRYRSWGHCYRYFRRRAWLREHRDPGGSALQLAFYLASWGMYRGSSFLLQKDCRIHRLAVREVLRPRYDPLLGFRASSPRRTVEAIQEILVLAGSIRDAYCNQISSVNGRRCVVEVTDTLATKILLATLACVPAYDAYVVEGLRAEGISYSTLNERTLKALFDWYNDRRGAFESVQDRIRENGLRYPPMKLADMYLWEIGRRASGAE
jgi:hypothetical protein